MVTVNEDHLETMAMAQVTQLTGKVNVRGHEDHCGRSRVSLRKATKTLSKLIVRCVLRCGIYVGHCDLAVVELLDDRFAFFIDVTHTDKLSLAVTLEKAAPYSINHSRCRAPTGNTAVFNVPEHAHRRDVFWNTSLWRTIFLSNLAKGI